MALIFTNGFEGFDDTEADPNAANDGWSMGNAGAFNRDWTEWDQALAVRTGAKSGARNTLGSQTIYRAITSSTQFEVIFYFGIRRPNGMESDVDCLIQIDDGGAVQAMMSQEPAHKPNAGFEIHFNANNTGGGATENYLNLSYVKDGGAVIPFHSEQMTLVFPASGQTEWYGFKIQVSNDLIRIYTDLTDSGEFTLIQVLVNQNYITSAFDTFRINLGANVTNGIFDDITLNTFSELSLTETNDFIIYDEDEGSGTTIEVQLWNYNQFMDAIGQATFKLREADQDSYNALLGWRGKKLVVYDSTNNVVMFRGSVEEIHTEDLYDLKFILKQKQNIYARREATLDFAQPLKADLTDVSINTSISTTQLTDTAAVFSTPAEALDNGEYGVVIVPDGTPAFSTQGVDEGGLSTVEGTGIQIDSGDAEDNINTDDENYIFINNPTGGTSTEITMLGTYSGTRTNVTDITVFIRYQAHEIITSGVNFTQVLQVQIYNYTTAQYDDIGVAPNSPNTYDRGTFGWHAPHEVTVEFIGDYTDYIKAADDEFKVRLTMELSATATYFLRIQYIEVKFYTNPFYDGTAFPITTVNSDTLLTVTGNPTGSGVDTGDGYSIGKINTEVLADLTTEHPFGISTDIDAGLTLYTAAKFGTQTVETWQALLAIAKREQAVIYYRDSSNTLTITKKANLSAPTITLTDVKGEIYECRFLDVQLKNLEQYNSAEVTGASYKRGETEVKIFQKTGFTGSVSNRVLRISDDTIYSNTEALERANGELALTQDRNPNFRIEFNSQLFTFYVGLLVNVVYKGVTYSSLPIKAISVTHSGTNQTRQILEVGWSGTPANRRQIDRTNKIQRSILKLNKSVQARTVGIVTGISGSHDHDHDALTNFAQNEHFTEASIDHTAIQNIGSLTHAELDSQLNAFNGIFLERFNALVTSNGAVITMTLTEVNAANLTMVFSDGHTTLDVTPGKTIALTAGTDASPQVNYIYILQSGKVLAKDTTGWPAGEHIKVGIFFVPSAGFVQTNNVYMNQNINDGTDTSVKQGHFSDMNTRMRLYGADYFSGIDPAGTSDYLTIAAGNVEFKSTAGVIYQMHAHAFGAVDTSGGDLILVKNWSGDAYHDITDLFDIVDDSTGTTLNNKWFTLVIWGISNKAGELDYIVINLPSGSYVTQAFATEDVNGYTDFSIPREFNIDSTTGFLIAAIVVKKAATWSFGATKDLRGIKASIAVAGGTGTGITDHGSLTGLADDDHTQYVTKAGSVTQLSDVGGAGSGTIISAAERAALHAAVTRASLFLATTDDVVFKEIRANGGIIKIYSTEAGKTDWRLSLNSLDADNMSVYNWDDGLAAYGNLRLGRNDASGPYVDGNTGYFYTDQLRSFSDTDHRIELDAAADEMHFYSGDNAGDNFFKMQMASATDDWPNLRSNADGEGVIGHSAVDLKAVYALNIYKNGVPLDEHDDLAIIDAMEVKKNPDGSIFKNRNNDSIIDSMSCPEFMRAKLMTITYDYDSEGKKIEGSGRNVWHGEYSNSLRHIDDLALGGVKKIHQLLKDQQETILLLIDRINLLENNN